MTHHARILKPWMLKILKKEDRHLCAHCGKELVVGDYYVRNNIRTKKVYHVKCAMAVNIVFEKTDDLSIF